MNILEIFNDPFVQGLIHDAFLLVLTAAVIPLTIRGVKWLKMKESVLVDEHETSILWMTVDALVKAAEQMIPEKSDRYTYVADFLAARFPYLTSAEIQILIEAAVHELKASKPVELIPGEIVSTAPVVVPAVVTPLTPQSPNINTTPPVTTNVAG